MTQLAITKALTPKTLSIRIQTDPYDVNAPTKINATVFAADESVLAAHSVSLKGLEHDFLASMIQTIAECWQWGAPAQQLAPAMKRHHREAKAHAKAHERA